MFAFKPYTWLASKNKFEYVFKRNKIYGADMNPPQPRT